MWHVKSPLTSRNLRTFRTSRAVRSACAIAATAALALGLSSCGNDAGGEADDPPSPTEETSAPSDSGSGSPSDGGTAPAGSLHECAELWNAADLDEVRSVLGAQHRQDSAETGQPDIVVGHYEGEPFALTAFDNEVTVPTGACVVVDVEGTTVDAEPQYGGYAAALVEGTWSSAVNSEHPLAEHPLPVTDPQLVKLDGGFEEPVLALP